MEGWEITKLSLFMFIEINTKFKVFFQELNDVMAFCMVWFVFVC